MIGIFKTNINTQKEKKLVIRALSGEFSVTMCTLDLEDCDKVLRVECLQMEEHQVISFVRDLGYQCAVLD
ncbi:hypothetical protein [uncultured Chitinophaga sp.]|uniref:hypothetical protein n=1 Tax=uncultured Chitinophaga sp. TaxID=339340 RepID=UPI002620B60A|nr:hypothetical protein [uncultured Chitinophaga sp.]